MGLGIDTPVNFGAAATAATGNFTLSAQAVSGALSHSASLTLAIQASAAAALPSDELRSNGLYAVSGVQLASVPLAIGGVSSLTTPAAGGASLTIRGSGFQPGIVLAIGAKPATATSVDMNTLTVVSPAVMADPQQLTLTNANGETVSLDAAVIAN
jgi:IPT/TIG domain-containing protein